jgi:DNA-binding MarR family transcriptional regulator
MNMKKLNVEDDPELMLGALLRISYRDLMDGFESSLADAGYPEVRLSHTPVLQPLSVRREGIRASELAMLAGMTKPSMGYLIEYLEQHGYVERVPDPSDKRAQLVRLTPRGWEMSQIGRKVVQQAEAEWVKLIGRKGVENLRQCLQELVAALKDKPTHADE